VGLPKESDYSRNAVAVKGRFASGIKYPVQ
jgi:hypothetical protein